MGIGLIATFWWLQWHPDVIGRGAPVTFFLLWLGYIVSVDSLVAFRTGSSPLSRGPSRWVGMFAVSVPGWWLFEYLNRFLNNWEYLGAEVYSGAEYALLASLSFSTVTPAVLTTAELVWTFVPGTTVGAESHDPRIQKGRRRRAAAAIGLGIASFFAITVWPQTLFPLAWIWVFLVLDPLNALAGWPALGGISAIDGAQAPGIRWRAVVSLAAAALICGFFWEMWNSRAWPKWIYHVPFFADGVGYEAPKLFEMPLPGYLGYLPFGLEVYAFYHYLCGLTGRQSATNLALDRGAETA